MQISLYELPSVLPWTQALSKGSFLRGLNLVSSIFWKASICGDYTLWCFKFALYIKFGIERDLQFQTTIYRFNLGWWLIIHVFVSWATEEWSFDWNLVPWKLAHIILKETNLTKNIFRLLNSCNILLVSLFNWGFLFSRGVSCVSIIFWRFLVV